MVNLDGILERRRRTVVNEVRPVDANELLKQSIYCKSEDGSMLYAVPISCIFAAPTLKVEPSEKPTWNTPDKRPTKEDADEDGCVMAVHKNWTGEASKWLFSVVANHPENFYCWFPLAVPPEVLKGG